MLVWSREWSGGKGEFKWSDRGGSGVWCFFFVGRGEECFLNGVDLRF